MTDPDRKLDEVPALIEERRRYEAWLDALDARRDTTPKHVFERVQTDYRERLRRVEERLAAHRQSIEEEQTSLASRLSLLKAEEQLRRDERAELELRTHVGELAGNEAEEAFRAVDEVIENLVVEKAELDRRIAALSSLLEVRPREAPAPAAVTTTAPPPAAAQAPAAAEKVVQPEPAAARSTGDSFDELAFLNQVVGEKDRRGQAAGDRAGSQQPAAPQATAPQSPAPQPAPQRPVPKAPAVQQPTAHAAPSQTAAAAKQPAQPPAVTPDEPAASESLLAGLGESRGRISSEPPFAANVPSNTPIVLRTVTAAEQSKTLKCGECGTMNYPTEWYCERCGAELAAL